MTTKIGYCSDTHIEFGDLDLLNKDNLDILILAGDICTPHLWGKNHDNTVRKIKDKQLSFFRRVSDRFPLTLFIPGNHEHYHGNYDNTEKLLQAELAQFSNIKVGTHVVHEGSNFVIIANTLWTDFNKGDPNMFVMANFGMNDFRIVSKGPESKERFRSQDAYIAHKAALINIENDLMRFPDTQVIMVSHHLPSLQAIHPDYKNDDLNGAYASDLDWVMEKYPNISHWIHGHSHQPCDIMIYNTRVLRNTRGYVGREHSWTEDAKYSYKVIEV